MKTACVIAEYNPFHKGHALQLKRLKEDNHFDHVIVIMSGNFVQRGAPSLLSKYERAEMALLNGADLLLELPVDFACANAGDFARGGVLLAKDLGVTDTLAFSCEDPEFFRESGSFVPEPLIDILNKEPEEFKTLLRRKLAEGLPYAKAREEALFSMEDLSGLKDSLAPILRKPNNLLALSYLTAVRSLAPGLSTLGLKREGAAHDSDLLSSELPSASAIRNAAEVKADISSYLPENCHSLIKKAESENRFLFTDDFSSLLKYRLLGTEDPEEYRGVDTSLAAKIKKHRSFFTTITELTGLLKTKDLSWSHISRALFSILLGLKKEDVQEAPGYARILGFKKSAEPLLHAIRKQSVIPLIAKDADHVALLRKELYVSDVYRLILEEKSGRAVKNDLQQPLIII